MEIIEEFRSRLRTALDMKNMKAIDLAKAIHVNRSTITLWLSGKTNARQDKIYQIAKYMNIDPTWLLGADVPFTSFEKAMNQTTSKSINDEIMSKVIKLNEDNKRFVLGYIDGMLAQQDDNQ